MKPTYCPLANSAYAAFPSTPTISGQGQCDSYSCSSATRYSQVAGFTKKIEKYRDSGTHDILTSYSEALTYIPMTITSGANVIICPHRTCKLVYKSGINHSACIANFANLASGNWKINTDGCAAMGTGKYDVACQCDSSTYFTTTGQIIEITIGDYCDTPNVLTGKTITAQTYEQYRINGAGESTTLTVTDLITIQDTSYCKFTSCKVTQAIAGVCQTTTLAWYSGSAATLPITTVPVAINTALTQATKQFCLECTDNNLTPTKRYSLPFDVTITQIDCTKYLTHTALATPHQFFVPSAGPFVDTQFIAGNSWWSTTEATGCTPTFSLVNGGATTAYSGNFVKVDATTGQLTYDQSQFGDATLRVKITANGGYVQYSNDFNVKHTCRPLTLSTIPDFLACRLPANPPQASQTLTDVSTYITTSPLSAASVCPRTYSVRNSDVGVTAYSGSFLSFTSPNLLVDNDLKLAENAKIRYTQQGLDVDSNSFKVECKCDASGYSINTDGSHVNPVTYSIDGNAPTFPVNTFVYPQPLCKATAYDFFDLAGNSPPTGLTPNTVNAVTFPSTNVQATSFLTRTSYIFKLRVTLEGGQQTYITMAGTDQLKLDVVCGPASTTLSQGWFPAGYTDTQINEKSKNICFKLPSFSSSVGDCEIQTYEVTQVVPAPISGALTAPGTGFVNNAVQMPPGSGQYQVCPQDDNVSAFYQFYIRLTARGGKQFMSTQMTLYHGCPVGLAQYQESPLFIRQIVKPVGVSKLDIYELFFQVTPASCTVDSFELVNLRYNGSPSIYGVADASSCRGTLPCYKLDLTWNDHPYTVTFQFRLFLTLAPSVLTRDVRIDLICTIDSATLTSTILTERSYRFEQYTINKISFDPFGCTPSACCTGASYFVSSSSGSSGSSTRDSVPVLDTNTSSSTYGKMVFEPYTGEIGVRYVYVFFQNPYGAQVVSSRIKIDVFYNCRFDRIRINDETLQAQENTPANLTFVPENRYNANPNLHLNLSTNGGSNFPVNITGRFVNNASAYCPLIIYQAVKYLDTASGLYILNTTFEDQVTVANNGILRLHKQNNPYQVLAFVNVSNGYVWLQQKDPLMLITLKEPWREPPNYAPYFDGWTSFYRINATVARGEQREFRIQLPPVIDSVANDTFFISMEDLPPFMFLDSKTRTLSIQLDQISREFITNTTWTVKLKDQKRAVRDYKLTIEFFLDFWVRPPEVIVVPDRRQYRYGPDLNVTAYIHSIDIYGLMEIRFNATMFTNISLDILNTSLLDIYMVPHDPEPGWNVSAWNLTWNPVFYNNSVLLIQLNFSDKHSISQKIVQDRIVFHIKEFSPAFYSPERGNFLHHDYWTLTSRVRKQLPDKWRPYMQAAEINVEVMKWMLIVTLLLAMVPTGLSFRYYMWYLRSLQLVVHLPMFYIVVPPNVCRYLEVVKPIVVFDLLPSEWVRSVLFTFDMEQHRYFQKDMLDQMEDIGYNTHNAIVILGSIWIYSLFYLGKLLVYLVYICVQKLSMLVARGETEELKVNDVELEGGAAFKKHFPSFEIPAGLQEDFSFLDQGVLYIKAYRGRNCTWKKFKERMRCIEAFKYSLFFTLLLQLLIEPYLEWAIAGIMNVRVIISTHSADRFSNFTGILSFILAFVVLPLALLKIYLAPILQFRRREYTDRFGVVFFDIRSRSRLHAHYIAVLTARRLAFLILVFCLEFQPTQQILLMIWMNIAMTFYIGSRPMLTRMTNLLHYLEELVIMACCAHMVVFMLSDDELVDLGYGWSMIVIMNLHFLIVCLWIAYLTKEMIRVIFRKYSIRWRVWAVRRFGYRIGQKYHNYFNVTLGDRRVPQMMKLGINTDTRNVTNQIFSGPAAEMLDKQIMDHLPHMIEKVDNTKIKPDFQHYLHSIREEPDNEQSEHTSDIPERFNQKRPIIQIETAKDNSISVLDQYRFQRNSRTPTPTETETSHLRDPKQLWQTKFNTRQYYERQFMSNDSEERKQEPTVSQKDEMLSSNYNDFELRSDWSKPMSQIQTLKTLSEREQETSAHKEYRDYVEETFSGFIDSSTKNPDHYSYKGFEKPSQNYSKSMKKINKLFK